MAPCLTRLRHFWRRDDGPTAVEYAVVLALIVLVCLAAIKSVGNQTRDSIRNSASSVLVGEHVIER